MLSSHDDVRKLPKPSIRWLWEIPVCDSQPTDLHYLGQCHGLRPLSWLRLPIAVMLFLANQ